MSAKSHAVVFDWNGTLIADTRLCLHATNKTLELFDVAPVSLAAYQDAYVVPLLQMYLRFGCKEQDVFARQSEFFEAFSKHYEAQQNRLRLRKGARQALGTIKERGNQALVLSNYQTGKITQQAERFKILTHLDAVLAHDDFSKVLYKKGKGEKLKAYLEENEIMRALVVGDTPEEIEIAHAYGYPGVALSDGVCSLARLRAAKPDYLIHSLDEVSEIARHVFERTDR